MVHTCVVVGCRNRRTPGTALSFYRFPRDPDRKQRWIAAVNRQGWQPNDGSRLCSTHFISGKQVKNPRSPDYVPSVFSHASLGSEETDPAHPRPLSEKQQAQVDAANALLYLQGQVLEQGGKAQVGGASVSVSNAASHSDADEGKCEGSGCQEELRRLRRENQALRELAERTSLTEATLRSDPEKVRFYTGLPSYFVLETVLWLLSPHMRPDKALKLSKFQQLLLTLMRLRLDLRNQDLAYRFGVQSSGVARAVLAVVELLSSTIAPTAVFWPSRDELRRNLPAALRSSCPDCAVIVDCFTLALQRPGPAHTLKYLIGMAPQGVVTFVSKGTPGHVSDRELAEGCGFVAKLLPGDVVLAGRGLDIGAAVAGRGARLMVADETTLQAYVERVIGMVRQRYAMLSGPVESPFTTPDRTGGMTALDRIIQVACALHNLCVSAAPLE